MKNLSAQILRAFSLVVTDRRWAAPLSAMALGFGLFVGVAIGPSATGTLAGGPRIIEMPSFGGGGSEEEGEGEVAGSSAPLAGPVAGAAGGGAGLGALTSSAPLAPAPVAEPVEEEAEPAPGPEQPAGKAPKEEAEEEEATELKGVVVHANELAGSYALAIEGGELVPVHARVLPEPGSKLAVTGSHLANGAFAEEEKPQRSGKAAQAIFRGVVTYADPDPADPVYTVSGRGASLLVHVPPDPTGSVAALPAVGAYVNVTTGFEPEEKLVQRQLEIEPGEPTTYLDLAGVFKEVQPETGLLLLSADSAGESEANLALSVPSSIDASKLKPGDSYVATATVEPDGSLTLSGIASDEHTRGADDPSMAQGDLKR